MKTMPIKSTLALAVTILALAVPSTAWASSVRDTSNAVEPLKTTQKKCGKYTVKAMQNGFAEPKDVLKLIYKGKIYATVQDYMVEIQQCEDINGDGIPEIVLMGFSGGAHCCSEHSVYSLTVPPKLLLKTFTGHGASIDIKQIDKGPKEIIGLDWRFAYAYDLSFAESPALPRIFAYKNGKYVDSTLEFPNYLVSMVISPKSKDYWRGGALSSYSLYMMAKQPEKAQKYLKSLPKKDREWLTKYLPEINKNLSKIGKSDTDK